MPSFEQIADIMMRALDGGPHLLPDGVFRGTRERILLGMKVHANTISHARLVALEDTFPHTLAAIGHDGFNGHSRAYLEQPGVTELALARIGEAFPQYLARCAQAPAIIDLARFEWAWLGAYHAADATALQLADLAGIAPEALMETVVQAHPAARLERFEHLRRAALRLEWSGLDGADAILIARAEGEILVSCATDAMHAIFALLGNMTTIGNLWTNVCEPGCSRQVAQDDFMPALIALIEAGALVRSDGQRVNWQQVD